MDFISINDTNWNSTLADSVKFKSINLFSRYYSEYYKEKFTDLTFALMEGSKILGHVLCCALDGNLTFFPEGGVIIKLYNNDLTQKEEKQKYIEILNHLKSLAYAYHCKSIIVKDNLKTALSPLGEQLLKLKFQNRLTFELIINYNDFSKEKFHSKIRKSYKSLINWGRKELDIICLNKDNADFETFIKFRDFHHKIAAKKTRSDESWRIQYEMIQEGLADLILGVHNNNLVAGSLFADHYDTRIYCTGVYERDLFDFGVSHFLLYDGICRSYEQGNTSKFSLGYFDANIQDPKFFNIQFFKKGFCKDLNPTILWSKEIHE